MLYCNTRVLQKPVSGVQRYILNILKHAPPNTFKLIEPKGFYKKIPGHLWEQFILPQKLSSADILFNPSNTAPLHYKHHQIVTIHDIAPIEHPEWTTFLFAKWYQFLIPRIIKRSEKIITVSNFTKERILHHYNFKGLEKKIVVIPNGIDINFFSTQTPNTHNTLSALLPPSCKRYILSVSSIEPRKNIESIILAFKQIEKFIDDDIYLVLCGSTLKHVFKNINIKEELPKRIVFTGYIPDNILPTLYQNALCFIYIPLYEGFGYPVIEAAAAGTPVIYSNIPCLEENVKQCGISVNPKNTLAIKDAIMSFITNNNLRQQYSLKGKQNALNYNIQKSVNDTINEVKK